MEENQAKQNRKVTVFAILLSVISIGVLVFGFTVVSSDKVVMLQSLSNLYNKVSNTFEDDFVLLNKIASSDNVGINTKNILTIGEDVYNINLNYLENSSNLLSSLDLSIMLNEDELTTKYILNNTKLYTYIKDVTSTYYYDDSEYDYFSFLKSLSENDYEKVLSLLKEIINDEISDDNIIKEKVTIIYDGKEKKVNKLTYNIDVDQFQTIVDSFITLVKKDKDLYKNISKLLEEDNDLLDRLNAYLQDIKNSTDGNFISYSTYYYGFNKIVEYELYSYIDDITFNYKTEGNIETINIIKGEDTLLNVVIGEDKNSFTFSGNISYFLEKLGIEKNNLTYMLYNDFTGSYKDSTFEIEFNGDTTYKLIISIYANFLDNAYKYSINTKVIDASLEEDKELYNISSEIEFVFDKEIEVSLENSLNYNELSDEEKTNIEENLNNNLIYQIIRDNNILEYFN